MYHQRIFNFLLFCAVVLWWQNGYGLAFDVGIHPNHVTEIKGPDQLQISCVMETTDTHVKEVVLLEILKEAKPIAVLLQNNTNATVAEDSCSTFQVEGKISSNVNESFLRVTVSDPRIDNAGTYTCVVFYLDHSGFFRDTRKSVDFNVHQYDVMSALKSMQEKMSRLETELQEQKDESKAKDAKIESLAKEFKDREIQLQGQISGLSDSVDNLQKQLQNQDEILKQHEEMGLSTLDRVIAVENTTKDQMTRLDGFITKYNITEMFTAVADKKGVFKQGEIIVYGNVITSEGQGYNKDVGVFTAPVDGCYFFHLSVTPHAGNYIFIDLKTSNGRNLDRIFTGDTGPWEAYVSSSCVVKLGAGEQVMPVIQLRTPSFALVDYSSTDLLNQFSGFLLKAL